MKQKLNLFFKRYPAFGFVVPVLLFIGIEGLFSFCSKVTCPAFSDPHFDKWFPYRPGQSFIFLSSRNNRDTLKAGRVEKSEAYDTYGTRSKCSMDAAVTLEQYGVARFYVRYAKHDYGNFTNVYFDEFRLSGKTLLERGLEVDSPVSASFSSNVVLDGKNFNEVLQLQRDTGSVKQTGIYKIWISKYVGLVGYERYPTLERWVKQ